MRRYIRLEMRNDLTLCHRISDMSFRIILLLLLEQKTVYSFHIEYLN